MTNKTRFVVIDAPAALAVVVLVFPLTSSSAEPQGAKAPLPRKKVIAWGGIDWYSPEKVQMHIRKIEELPFDGTVLQGFKANKNGKQVIFDWLCFGKEKFDRHELAETIATLKNIKFKTFTDNFLRFNVTPGDVDWFDDFGAVLHNARLWAEVAKETGMKGWAFDVEDYKGTVFDYRKMKHAKRKSFDEYAQQAQLRGRQFIAAVQEGYPSMVVMLMLAHSYVNREARAAQRLHELEYGLLPAFLNGMVEVAGPQVRILDGHEQAYGYLTAEDHFRGYHSARQQALVLVPPELREKYRAKMDVAMALYVDYVFALTDYPGHWPTHFMAVEDRLPLFEQTVFNALTTTDEYVWLYTERISWWEPGAGRFPTPDGALAAVRSAREKVQNGEPLGFEMTDRVNTAKSKLKEANPVWPARESILAPNQAGRAAPEIDGLLEDAVWKDVPPLHPFVPLKGATEGTKLATVAKAAIDSEHLYVAFRCAEGEVDRLNSVGKKKDDGLWKGDCVEVFLRAGDGMPPFHFIVNPQNLQWDGKGDVADWNAEWRSGARIGKDAWTVEIAIPWKAIGVKPSGPFAARAHFIRRRAATKDLTALVQDLSASIPPP